MRKATNLLVIYLLFTAVLLNGCKEDPIIPTVTTMSVSDITTTAAKSGGNITSDGGAEVIARGVCWGSATGPSVSGSHTSDGEGPGSFTSNLTGLPPDTKYYIRAYAVNSAGTAYGNEVSFTTNPIVGATLTTTNVETITATSAVSGGNITADGGGSIIARGICWNANVNPTIANNKTSDGSGSGVFTSNITNLQPGTTYYVRAYATNSSGTTYGNEISFKSLAVTPALTTSTVSGVTINTAISGGNITSDGGGSVTARGVCWGTSHNPTIAGLHTTDGTGTGIYTSSLTGLTPNTLYYVRAYANNSAGTAYGNEVSFTTNPVLPPALTTTEVTSITLTAAISGGNITSDGGGPVNERGVCWSTSSNPTILGSHTSNGTGTGSFTSNLTGLSAGTAYYVRAYATNSGGTAYGNQIRFATSVSDLEGNIYKTVIIGNQVWMAEDLKATKYNDNSSIPNITNNLEWSLLTTPAYSWYDNNPSYGNTYGILYNYYTVETGRLCPAGWHMPADAEFKILEMSLGMTQEQADGYSWRGTDQGTKLRSTVTWLGGGNGTNSSGFSALGGGYRYGADGTFNNLGTVSYWWSSSIHETDDTRALYRRLDGNQGGVYREGVLKTGGKFVRCLKN